jgi:hypothetical protein
LGVVNLAVAAATVGGLFAVSVPPAPMSYRETFEPPVFVT